MASREPGGDQADVGFASRFGNGRSSPHQRGRLRPRHQREARTTSLGRSLVSAGRGGGAERGDRPLKAKQIFFRVFIALVFNESKKRNHTCTQVVGYCESRGSRERVLRARPLASRHARAPHPGARVGVGYGAGRRVAFLARGGDVEQVLGLHRWARDGRGGREGDAPTTSPLNLPGSPLKLKLHFFSFLL